MHRDDRIDAYIAAARPFAQPILVHVREVAHRALLGAEETLKWGAPHFMVSGKNVVGTAAFTAHAGVMIVSEDRAGGGMGSLGKLTAIEDLPSDEELIRRFQASREVVLAKKASKQTSKVRPASAIPRDFSAALSGNAEAMRNFGDFTDAQRRDYIEWIVEAKRHTTRANRIETAVDWLSHGKKRNWKYEKC